MKLFEGDDDVEKLSKIEINKEFACRFEHNKKREDLQRFEELKKKGLVDEDDSSDESEDDDDDNDFGKPISEKDAEFFNALIKIRNKDPILQNKDAKLFESESESEPDSEADDKKKEKVTKKPMYLKDVVSKHLIEEGPEFNDEDEEEDKDKKKVKTYSEEQEELRKEFLDAVEKMEMENKRDGEDFFKVKERGDEDVEDDDGDAGEFSKKLDEYFGDDDKLDENDRFLKDYFRNKMWMNSDEKGGKEDDEGFGFSEDEEEIEKQEDFERDFNFRFEENAGDRVWGHSRKVEGSVRKKTNARKLQRERKEERMAKEGDERKEELKRLKNLKKKEMREKLEKIKETAGIGEDGVCLLDEDDLEEEFNPEEYDKKMKKAFGEAYYEAGDVNPDFGSDEDADEGDLEKPDFDKEDELLGLPKGWDEMNQPRDGFLSIRERILKSQENTGEEHETVDDQVDEEDGVSEEGKQKKKQRKNSVVMQAAKDQLMEEYYKLEYEDVIGDLKTRFKYKPVNAKRFGLSTEEMLMLDDKELNQYVPLKTLAPYRDKDWKVPRAKRHQQKQKIKELIQGKTLDIRKNEKKRPRDQETTVVGNYTENEKPHLEGSNGDTSTLSRKKRRKMRLAELKPSHRRLLAFGFNKKK